MQDTYRVVWWLQLLISGLIHRLTVRWQHLWMRQGTTWISRRSITWRNRVTRSEITWRNRAIRLASARVTRVFASQGTAVTFVTYFRQRVLDGNQCFPPRLNEPLLLSNLGEARFTAALKQAKTFAKLRSMWQKGTNWVSIAAARNEANASFASIGSDCQMPVARKIKRCWRLLITRWKSELE